MHAPTKPKLPEVPGNALLLRNCKAKAPVKDRHGYTSTDGNQPGKYE